MNMKTTRAYRMGARGEAVAATRRRILEAGASLGLDDLNLDPTLEDVADRAEVSVQTVLRHFGTRQALLTAIVEFATSRIEQERRPVGADPASAVDAVLAHYEHLGDFSLALLARESVDPRSAELTTRGKAFHRRWVEDAFAAALPPRLASRDALIDLLVVATDVYAWKLLRRDRGYDLAVVRERMLAMVHALLATAA
jgi:AcrR family transcriptional regulator